MLLTKGANGYVGRMRPPRALLTPGSAWRPVSTVRLAGGAWQPARSTGADASAGASSSGEEDVLAPLPVSSASADGRPDARNTLHATTAPADSGGRADEEDEGADLLQSQAVQEPPPPEPLSVAGVQADPDATIDAIARLTRAPEQQLQLQQQQQEDGEEKAPGKEQQLPPAAAGPVAALAAAAAAAWAAALAAWATLAAAAVRLSAAATARLERVPRWAAARRLSRLRRDADAAPADATAQAALLAALNAASRHRDVLARVEGRAFASSPSVVVEYLKALVASERLDEYADAGGKAVAAGSSSGGAPAAAAAAGVGLGPGLAPGQDHRSLLSLLQELEALAAGGSSTRRDVPGGSVRRPLHVVLQVCV